MGLLECYIIIIIINNFINKQFLRVNLHNVRETLEEIIDSLLLKAVKSPWKTFWKASNHILTYNLQLKPPNLSKGKNSSQTSNLFSRLRLSRLFTYRILIWWIFLQHVFAELLKSKGVHSKIHTEMKIQKQFEDWIGRWQSGAK